MPSQRRGCLAFPGKSLEKIFSRYLPPQIAVILGGNSASFELSEKGPKLKGFMGMFFLLD
jgi:hypothetical protein